MEPNSSIKDKIRKLIALSESERDLGNHHAAEAAMDKAVQLLYDNGLNQGDIQEPEPFIKSKPIPYNQFYNNGACLLFLNSVIADYCLTIPLTELVRIKKGNRMQTVEKSLVFLGREANVLMAEYYFVTTAKAFEKLARKADLTTNTGRQKVPSKTFITNYLWGCVYGLAEKINNIKAEQGAKGTYITQSANKAIIDFFSLNDLKKTKIRRGNLSESGFWEGLSTGK
ncbi:MAG: DUF2786 domain-containing protein, partial [Chitinophagia bacterium]|nr:DUF2786 domain-containing protein [Chitinophagia bacterium]